MSKVTAMPEILGAFLTNADANALKADATSYIKDKAGFDLSGNEINIVENTDATVHVALPYYAVVGNPPAAIGEDDLEASGGSVAGAAILGVTVAASAAAAAATGTGVFGIVNGQLTEDDLPHGFDRINAAAMDAGATAAGTAQSK